MRQRWSISRRRSSQEDGSIRERHPLAQKYTEITPCDRWSLWVQASSLFVCLKMVWKAGISVRILVQSGSGGVSGFDTFRDWHLPGVKSDTRTPQHRNRELFTPRWLMTKSGHVFGTACQVHVLSSKQCRDAYICLRLHDASVSGSVWLLTNHGLSAINEYLFSSCICQSWGSPNSDRVVSHSAVPPRY